MGSLVTVLLRTETDEPLINSDYYAELIETEYPGAVVVGYATIRYNCHAYAWANSTFVWMNDPSPYWSDGSYIRVDAEDQNIIGNKIYYPGFGNEHSGVVIRSHGNTIESKWGDKNLVQHALENCPYYHIPLQIRVYEGQF